MYSSALDISLLKIACAAQHTIVKYSGISFIQTPINQTLHLPNLLDNKKQVYVLPSKNQALCDLIYNVL